MEEHIHSQGACLQAFTRDNLTDSSRNMIFSVTNPNKSGIVRVVFDTAAECVGTSLNNHLFQGSHSNSLQCPLKVSAGQQGPRKRSRLLAAAVVEWKYMYRSPTWRACEDCPYLQYWRVGNDNKDFDPVALETSQLNFFVDKILKSVPTPGETTQVASQLVELWYVASMTLSSSAMIIKCWLRYLWIAGPSLNLDVDVLPVNQALGVNVEDRIIWIQRSRWRQTKHNEWRGINDFLSLWPLTFGTVMLTAKQIIQILWQHKVLRGLPRSKSNKWLHSRQTLCLKSRPSCSITLCTFHAISV